MSLAQDLRNAWDNRDRAEFERLLDKVVAHALVAKLAEQVQRPPLNVIKGTRDGTNKQD